MAKQGARVGDARRLTADSTQQQNTSAAPGNALAQFSSQHLGHAKHGEVMRVRCAGRRWRAHAVLLGPAVAAPAHSGQQVGGSAQGPACGVPKHNQTELLAAAWEEGQRALLCRWRRAAVHCSGGTAQRRRRRLSWVLADAAARRLDDCCDAKYAQQQAAHGQRALEWLSARSLFRYPRLFWSTPAARSGQGLDCVAPSSPLCDRPL